MKDYARTRNYLDGGVSHLSPYLSRGVLTLPQVKNKLLERVKLEDAIPFLYELTWREYFQRTWWKYQDGIFSNLTGNAARTQRKGLIRNIVGANTGITIIDEQINQLYKIGYIHNHARMYIASLASNIGQSDWQLPSQWMYYHLLDGDVASNTLSWQWVAGTFSLKKYFFNQENINKFSQSLQQGTFLDIAYEKLPGLELPPVLDELISSEFITVFPSRQPLKLDPSLPLLLYNSYNLDPTWKKQIDANRVLLLEPSHFVKFPVSEKVMNFIIELSTNIDNIQVFVGEVNDIPTLERFESILSKPHPSSRHYPGEKDEPQWMFANIEPKASFTAFWKLCEHSLIRK